MVWQEGNTAAAWARSASQRNQMMAAATERMFALAGVAEGMRVLDVGAAHGSSTSSARA
jgi:cyclopropane fatty-acyl-phospholipid synthase-like methyltransferase